MFENRKWSRNNGKPDQKSYRYGRKFGIENDGSWIERRGMEKEVGWITKNDIKWETKVGGLGKWVE